MTIFHYATDTTANDNCDLPIIYDSSTNGACWNYHAPYSPPILSEAERRRRRGENPRAQVGEIIWKKSIVK